MFRRALSVVVAIAILLVLPYLAAAQSADAASRRGDIAVGYRFGYGGGYFMPAGFQISEAWRVHPKIDLIADTSFQHASIPLAGGGPGTVAISSGFNVLGVMGGMRFSSPTRYGNR